MPCLQFLKTSRDGDSTTSVDSLSRCLKPFWWRNFVLIPKLNLPRGNLRPFPCVLSSKNQMHPAVTICSLVISIQFESLIIHLDLANTCKVKHMFWFIMAFLISDYFFSTHSGGSITNFLTVLAFQCCKVPLCQAAQRSAACASWAKGGSCTLAVMRKFVGGNFPNQNLAP